MRMSHIFFPPLFPGCTHLTLCPATLLGPRILLCPSITISRKSFLISFCVHSAVYSCAFCSMEDTGKQECRRKTEERRKVEPQPEPQREMLVDGKVREKQGKYVPFFAHFHLEWHFTIRCELHLMRFARGPATGQRDSRKAGRQDKWKKSTWLEDMARERNEKEESRWRTKCLQLL